MQRAKQDHHIKPRALALAATVDGLGMYDRQPA